MAARKSERLMNLTIALLTTRTFLPRERLRAMVEGYADLSDEAFGRMFERDKDELRRLGVPVQTGSFSALFADELGYRIERADFELPPVELSAEEGAVLAVAAQVWQEAGVASSTAQALAKLRADGEDPDTTRLAVVTPHIQAREPAFEPLWQAVLARRVVAFRYRGGTEERRLEPWTLLCRRGAWYVVGWDQGRAARRHFKLSRITAGPDAVGEPEAYRVPDDLDAAALLAALEPSPADATALVAIRGERAPGLRRRAALSGTVADGVPAGYAAYLVPYATESGFVGELAQAGPDVLVLQPLELVDALRDHLGGLIAALAPAEGGRP